VLSAYQKLLLREIYGIPDDGDVVVGDKTGLAQNSIPFTTTMTVKERLNLAIAAIDKDEAKSQAVAEILCAYQDFRLDRSPINRDGYAFSPSREENNLLRRLFSYTNILVLRGGSDNAVRYG